MKFVAATVASAAVASATTLANSSPEAIKEMFEQFKLEHGKSYSTMQEESVRYGAFVNNLKVIDARNAAELSAGGSAEHGVTKFSDLSEEEFASMFLTLQVPEVNNATYVDVKPYEGTESLVDWTGKYTTAVKDQGYCGSCWAFAASEQMESDSMRMQGTSYTLSPEQLVDCDSKSSGCNGGWPEWAYDHVKHVGGIEQEKDYPYSAYNGHSSSCKEQSSKYVIGVTSYSTLRSESQMTSHVKSTGPLSICIDASTWSSYKGGIMSSCGKSVNHAVQAVGVDDSNNGYWKVRNSWGRSWGESGFIRLAYGQDTCNIDYSPSYTSTKKV